VVLAVVATHSDRAEAHSFEATLASPSAIVEIKLRLLRAASTVLDNERAASPCSHLALLCLLVLTLNGKAAGVAANALVEQTKITQILASSLLDTASDSYPRAGAGAAEVTTLATVAMSTLHKLISVHGAAASSVLARCGIELERVLNRLPGRGGSQHQMPLDLCELFATLAEDPALAARMCCPRLLEALKQPLISGRPDLQLAAIDVLTSIERHVQNGAQALCAEDIVSFLLELLRTPPPVMSSASLACRDSLSCQSSGGGGRGTGDERGAGAMQQQQAELRGGAIALLGELLHTPQRHSSTLLARVVGALWPVARGTTQEARRHLLFPGLRGTQAQLQALNAEHAPQPLTMLDRVGALTEFHANARCAASLLGWYKAQPTDVAHVLGFCRDGARLIKSFEGEPAAGHALQGDPRADQLRSRLAAATNAHQRTVTLSLVADLVAAALQGGAADAAACTSVLQLCDSLVLPMLLQTLVSRVADVGPEIDDCAECSLTAALGDGEAAALAEAALAALVGSAIELLLLLLGDSALGDETRLEFACKQSRDCLWLLDLATQANLPAARFTVGLLAALGRVPDPDAQRLDHSASQHGLAPRDVLAMSAPSDLAGCVAELRIARHAVPLHALELLLLILEHARAATDSEDGSAVRYELDSESRRQVAAGYSALRAVASAHYGSLHTKVPVATLRRFASACLLPMLEGAARGCLLHAPSAECEMAYAGLTHALLHCTPREVLQDPSCVAWLAGCATHARARSGLPFGASTTPDGEGGEEVAAWRMLLACALECYGPAPSAAEELHPSRDGEAQQRGLNPVRHGGDAPQLAANDGDRLRNSLVCGCRAVGAHTAEMLVSLLAAHLQSTAMVPGGVVAALALTHAFIFGPDAWASDTGDGGDTPTRSHEAGAAVELHLRQLVAAGLNTAMSRLFLYSNLDDEALALAFRLVAACFSVTTAHGEPGASDACLLEALHHALGSAGRLLASGGSLSRAMEERRGGAPVAAHEWCKNATCTTMQLELLNLLNVALAVAQSDETHLAVAGHPELLAHVSQLALGAAGGCYEVATESKQQEGVRLGALALLVQVLDKALEACTRQEGRAVPAWPPHLAAVLSEERLSLSSLLSARALSQVQPNHQPAQATPRRTRAAPWSAPKTKGGATLTAPAHPTRRPRHWRRRYFCVLLAASSTSGASLQRARLPLTMPSWLPRSTSAKFSPSPSTPPSSAARRPRPASPASPSRCRLRGTTPRLLRSFTLLGTRGAPSSLSGSPPRWTRRSEPCSASRPRRCRSPRARTGARSSSASRSGRTRSSSARGTAWTASSAR